MCQHPVVRQPLARLLGRPGVEFGGPSFIARLLEVLGRQAGQVAGALR